MLAAIKRMRTESADIDDEAHVQCRTLLALLETTRIHGGFNFLPIARDVNALFEAWQAESHSVPAHIRERRQQNMARYAGVIRIGKNHWDSILAIEAPGELHGPLPPARPNYQTNYFGFLAGMQITSLITESYGYSICEPIDREALNQRLEVWYSSFEAATARPELLGMKDIVKARLYFAHYIRCTILLDACINNTEDRYSQHETDFTTLLKCMERVLASGLWQDESMWLGIVCPPFFTAVHCRNRTLRHRALELLHTHDISERSWNSRIAYLIASAVIALESSHASLDATDDKAFVRLLNADFKASTSELTVTYKDISSADHSYRNRFFKMLVMDLRIGLRVNDSLSGLWLRR
jgi:hypothetical protein